jgi:cbb3-type cytochrome oxidase maturation protein
MSVLILLIACSILIAGGFLIAFIWSVKKGQYDDDYTPSVRMLFDDKPVAESKTSLTPSKNKVHASTGKISV